MYFVSAWLQSYIIEFIAFVFENQEHSINYAEFTSDTVWVFCLVFKEEPPSKCGKVSLLFYFMVNLFLYLSVCVEIFFQESNYVFSAKNLFFVGKNIVFPIVYIFDPAHSWSSICQKFVFLYQNKMNNRSKFGQ